MYAHSYLSGNFKTQQIALNTVNKNIPIALFVGKDDLEFTTIKDNRKMRDGLHDSLVHYEEVNGSRTTFLIGKEMSYFSKGVLNLLDTFHPVDPKKIASSMRNAKA